MADIPELATDRLLLRAHEREDLDASYSMWSDPETIRFIGDARSRERVWRAMLSYRGSWQMLGFGYWAIEDRLTGRFAGECGFVDFQRDIDSPLLAYPEAGWFIHPDFHRQGIATEAMTAALSWLDDHIDQPRSFCLINMKNDVSQRLARRLGYQEEGTVAYLGEKDLIFSRLRYARSKSP